MGGSEEVGNDPTRIDPSAMARTGSPVKRKHVLVKRFFFQPPLSRRDSS